MPLNDVSQSESSSSSSVSAAIGLVPHRPALGVRPASVELVERRERGGGGGEARRLHHAVEAAPGVLQRGPEVRERLPPLRLEGLAAATPVAGSILVWQAVNTKLPTRMTWE